MSLAYALNELPADTPLAAILQRLVDDAFSALEGDRETARQFLARASALLRAEREKAPITVRRTSSGTLANWQVRKTADYIETHLEATISLSDLANLNRLSASYFTRAFRGSFGDSPHNYVMGRRVARAKYLMVTGDEPLAQIANVCGFADQAHLSRVFRRTEATAPNAWRRTHRCDPSLLAPDLHHPASRASSKSPPAVRA